MLPMYNFVKVIVACPHRLPKLPEFTLRKQARPNNGSLFYSGCALCLMELADPNEKCESMMNILTYVSMYGRGGGGRTDRKSNKCTR
jgi:hypothetical protein